MLEAILRCVNNWFEVPNGIHAGEFCIQGGDIVSPFLMQGQYYRICGSVFNDGLHIYGEGNLLDEEFEGTVWALAIPADVVELANEIAEWQEKNGEAAASPYQSESFGGYSYSKGGDTSTWEKAFKARLDAYRKAVGRCF